MKIAFISTVRGYSWAGSEELWYGTSLLALEAGHEVSVYIHRDLHATSQIRNLMAKGAEVHFRRTLLFPRLWAFQEKINPSFPVHELQSCDVIVLSLGSVLDVFYIPGLREALLRTTTPRVMLCQFNAECLAFDPELRAQLRTFAEKSAGCCFVSQQNLDLAERQVAMKLPAAQVISNPIRLLGPHPLAWPENKTIRFACVARFDTLWKGQDLLLEILSGPAWSNRDWTLSFFGEGPDLEHLRNAVAFYGLEKRIEFRGYVRELETIWLDHHLMVLPSRGEGLSLAILEAMMCGRPVVTTDVGGNREALEDGVTGFIAEAATPYSFAKTLEQAWNAQSRWMKMGQAAHHRALEIASLDPSRKLLDYLTERYQASIKA
jgi:glycosyltransferase involved in cell wall biosynthesis